MYKTKKRVIKKHMMSIAEAENQLFLKLGFPVCLKCGHAMTGRLHVNGANYLLCPYCGETAPDCEKE